MSKEEFIIFNPEGGLGKIIASTAVARAIKSQYPDKKLIVVTPWPEVYLNNPHVYRVYRSGNTPYFYKDYMVGKDTIVLKGEPYFNTGHLYNRQHLIQSWTQLFNIKFDGNIAPELFYTPAEISKVQQLILRDKPSLLLQTNGGMFKGNNNQYCWTRDIPHNQAQLLVNELSKYFQIFHVTRPECRELVNTERVAEIDKRTLMLMAGLANKRVLIDSCLQHAAAAFNAPSTVLWVGTHPEVFGYPIHNNIKPAVPLDQEKNTAYIDSLFFDYDFNGPEHEYPFTSSDIFNLQDVVNSVLQDASPSVEGEVAGIPPTAVENNNA